MIENYLIYLKYLDKKLSEFFEKQKPYIFCKEGCAKCCKNAEFPYSQIEAAYLSSGISKLDCEKLDLVKNNIRKIKQAKSVFKGEKFLYDCPFLINNSCCVYEYRGIVCRTFGLLSLGSNGKTKVPFCCFEGYNYANVMDDDGKQISAEKFKKLNISQKPIIFNLNYDFLTHPDFERGFKFKFGDKKPLIDWF